MDVDKTKYIVINESVIGSKIFRITPYSTTILKLSLTEIMKLD